MKYIEEKVQKKKTENKENITRNNLYVSYALEKNSSSTTDLSTPFSLFMINTSKETSLLVNLSLSIGTTSGPRNPPSTTSALFLSPKPLPKSSQRKKSVKHNTGIK